MSQTRKLAAIMFTDIVGYTELMGVDEQRTFEILAKNRKIHEQAISMFNGRLIKELGDGVMAAFTNVSDAIYASIEIMDKCVANNEFTLRIGVHLAEVVFENEDVYGDGVNIASRIQSAASPGSIFISEAVHTNIVNKIDINTTFVREERLKNVQQPVKLYKVLTEGLDTIKTGKTSVLKNKYNSTGSKATPFKKLGFGVIFILALAASYIGYTSIFKGENNDSNTNVTIDEFESSLQKNSIAVLPFVNISNDPEQEYFSDGISEEIINVLAQVSELNVIARTSSFSFKGKNLDVKSIGTQLNVSHILEGSVQKSGNELRINANLINTEDGMSVYSRRFKRVMDDIFVIQDEISTAILDAVKIKLLENKKIDDLSKYRNNIDAYQHYLKGIYHQNRMEFAKAIESYEKAITSDENYAIAYAKMSMCFADLAYYVIEAPKNILQATSAAERALQLDEMNAECLVAMARIEIWNERNFDSAKEKLTKALKINPNNAEGLRQIGSLSMFMGHHREGEIYLDKADKLDPLSLMGLSNIGTYYYHVPDIDKMMDYSNRVIELEPKFPGGYIIAGLAYLSSNRYDEAISEFETAHTLNPDLNSLHLLGAAYAGNRDISKARTIIQEMESMVSSKTGGYAYLGIVNISLGEVDTAITYFEKALENREGHILIVPSVLRNSFPELLDNPDIIRILERIGLPF